MGGGGQGEGRDRGEKRELENGWGKGQGRRGVEVGWVEEEVRRKESRRERLVGRLLTLVAGKRGENGQLGGCRGLWQGIAEETLSWEAADARGMEPRRNVPVGGGGRPGRGISKGKVRSVRAAGRGSG